MKVNVEVTDTFGGEANYSWVRRYSFEVPDAMGRGSIVRRAKKEIGWNGKRCLRAEIGETTELRPYGECVVAFINVE